MKRSKNERTVSSSSSGESDSDSSSGSGSENEKSRKKMSKSEVEKNRSESRGEKNKSEAKTKPDRKESLSAKPRKHDDEDHHIKSRKSKSEHEEYHENRSRDRDRYKQRDRGFKDDRSRSRDHHNDSRDRREEEGRNDSRFRRRDRDRDHDRRESGNRHDKDGARGSRSFDHANAKWGKPSDSDVKKEPVSKEKPNFSLSGKLTEERNTYKGVVIKYSEPPEARKPKRRWRLYPFKGEKAMQTLYIHRESAYLIGRDRKVVDLPVDHPSCSKQHAALQYRLVSFTREDGTAGKRVRPYLIDLDSANGTFINNKKIDTRKYVELLEKDVIKFGFSSREYVLLHENSKDEAQDDDVKQEDVSVKEEPEN